MVYAKIKEKRKKYNISQTKLSIISGYKKTQISEWELEKALPSVIQLKKLESALNKAIFDIDKGYDDIRKKRIVNNNSTQNKKTPNIIDSEIEYNKKLKFCKWYNSKYSLLLKEMYTKAVYKKKNNAPKAIALFSGCGGFSLGFAAEGFNLVGHVEIEKSANRIYEANFKDSVLLGEDICKLSDADIREWKEKFGEIDTIIGGPPCQGYSLAGKRNPEDVRNQLYKYYVNIVSIIKPKIFVFERSIFSDSISSTNKSGEPIITLASALISSSASLTVVSLIS